MVIILVIVFALLACFVGVLLVGAPYLPTLKPQVNEVFKLSNLKAGDSLIELGCGDGRVLVAAAKRGIRTTGYELNPILAFIAWIRTRRYNKLVNIVVGNFWTKEWPRTDVIFVFLLDKYMEKLDKKCVQYPHKPIQLVSFAFKVPGKRPAKEKNGLFLYKYN
jgi:hypothetical protein